MYKLPVVNVYCSVSRVLAAKQQYGDIRLLLQCIQKAAVQTRSHSLDALCDEIIMAAIKVISNQAKEVRRERERERERERDREGENVSTSVHSICSISSYCRQNRPISLFSFSAMNEAR